MKKYLFAALLLAAGFTQAGDHPYGGIHFAGTVEIAGIGIVSNETIWAESYPTQYYVKAVLGTGQHLYAFSVPDDPQGIRFPLMDESLWFMPPMTSNAVMEVSNLVATAAYWVDPETGSDSNTGTEAAPFATLQKAVNSSSTASSAYTVIHAGEGEYTNGTSSSTGVTAARLLIDRRVRIKGDGRGKSVIRGVKDTTSGLADAYGCGPDAVRCVQVTSFDKCCVQGFTLADGYSGLNTASADSRKGGVIAKGAANFFCDCSITNCYGYNGTAGYFGSYVRTLVSGCDAISGQTLLNSSSQTGLRLISSIARHRSQSGTSTLIDQATAIQSTITGERLVAGSDGAYGFKTGTVATNCVIGAGNRSVASGVGVCSNVIWDAGCVNASLWERNTRFGSGYTADVPLLYNVYGDDARPLSSSPCCGAGLLNADYYKTYSPDVNGEPILFVNGRPTVGAVQTTVQTLIVPDSAAYATLTVSGADLVTNGVAAGDVVTLSLSNMTRPGGSFMVNGVKVLGPTYTFTAGAWDGTMIGNPFIISEVVFSGDWYVDAVNGDDANTGFYPGTGWAKKNLLPFATNTAVFKSGDTLHAAPGTYDSGFYESSSGRSRVYIKEGMKIVADEGPEKTFIVGADAPAENADAYGCGTGAVRCVSIDNNATIDGFTITGGRTESGLINDALHRGSGIAGSPGSLVKNCIISNNVAGYAGGGVVSCTNINCRIFNNRADQGSGVRQAYALIGCIVDGNRGTYAVNDCSFMFNTTLGAANSNLAETAGGYTIYYPLGGGRFENCIVLGAYRASGDINAYNCVFANRSDSHPARVVCYGNTVITNAADIVLDANYAPTAKDSFLVNSGTNSTCEFRFEGKDVLGGQRIYDGVIDIGAVEYDWRGEYKKDIAPRAEMVVSNATPMVYESGSAVRVPTNSSVTVVWTRETADKAFVALDAAVTGTGTLNVYCDGSLVGTRDASGSGEMSFGVTGSSNVFVFEYVAGESDTGYAELRDFSPADKGFIMLFR
ncbi:MAG: DUF1565 domain-containing protein [Kiritimatiellae bacterium]|nr:DUF1565 domain-containing protein [Kiritimatiellia bacterium]